MTASPAFRVLRSNSTLTQSDLIFPFLAPSIHHLRNPSNNSIARFSTSTALWKGDNNKNRGLSALRHTGLRKRQALSVLKQPIPKPVTDFKGKEPVQGDEEHGLWGFFKSKQLLQTPLKESRHGRSWTVPELRSRSWEDLHALWWVCVKERNRLATEKLERDRVGGLYGDDENQTRDDTVQETMKAIMDTLQERHKAWKDAYQLAGQDPTVDLKNNAHNISPYSSDPEDYQEAEVPEVAGGQQSQQVVADKEGKLPEERFFNTQDNKPSFKEQVEEKTKKVLWNK
ncbi:MRP-L47-domain-containing protein [Aaosphaeria arxii CBS 175.79]|uniref:Large ribosomal subunit protein uL29m n=1 Tax=Aaosphaeria arxii CBS 175.79 TaxID=1450172 RepID=A0A6A5Y1B5_9PLEO|nr:MRP-L47-domain-containing protein [Aaosphaeria arxii CBS 175.79]KAF2019345.1 MRP-L47-domain-containing protein [Aaosphaeria arxii CBS 175.79]